MTVESQPKQSWHTPAIRIALRDLRTGLTEHYGSDSPSLVVYGSHARGDATKDSDLDVLLVYNHPVSPSLEIAQLVYLLADLNIRHDLLISILPVSAEDFRKAKGPFWRNVRREGVTVNVR